MIGYMSLEEQVDKDFLRAHRRALFRRLAARLRRKKRGSALLAFEEARRDRRADNRFYVGRKAVRARRTATGL